MSTNTTNPGNMSLAILHVGVAAVHLLASKSPGRSSRHAELQHDPDTIEPCGSWENNYPSYPITCEQAKKKWNVSAEQMTRWNPSVGKDCKPWMDGASYCVLAEDRIYWDDDENTSTTTEPPVVLPTTTLTSTGGPTTSEMVPGPRPEATWKDLGCYDDTDPEWRILEQMTNQGFQDSLHVEQCKKICYGSYNFEFAGVSNGDECWCGNFIAGDLSYDQEDCDIECSSPHVRGSKCGGKGKTQIFQAIPVESD